MQYLWGTGPIALTIALVTAGCSRNDPPDFSKLSDEFVYTTLSFSPAGSTAAGLHEYKGRKLDDMLDDFSPAALDAQR
jgi:hypothetical protein